MSDYRLEKPNVSILVASQMLFMIATITVMTLSGVVGAELSPDPSLATLPIAMMMIGTVLFTLPASLFMKRVGRRVGFIVGASVGGIGGGALSFIAIYLGNFGLFVAGSVMLGLYQAFAMYYRFAAADVASPAFRSKAISLVMAAGVAAAFLGPLNASRMTNWIESVPLGGSYLMIAILALAAIAMLSFLKVPPAGEPEPGAKARSMGEIARQGNFIVAVLAAAIGYAVMVLVMTATPLSMRAQGYGMNQVATIMQWHVLGMFAPSFITGSLITRFGVGNVLLAGAALLVATTSIAVSGQSMAHYWFALVLLGVGWNFLFVGGSALVARSHTEAERGKVQGVNDLIIFSFVAIGSLMSGTLLHWLGWNLLNLLMLPLVLIVALSTLWLIIRQSAAQQPSPQ